MSIRTAAALSLIALIAAGCAPAKPCPDDIYYGHVAWSADGARLYYSVHWPGSPHEIHSMDAQGGDDRFLMADSQWPHPSPGGRWLLVIHGDFDRVAGQDPAPFALLDLETMQERILGKMEQVDWSPGGQSILYTLGKEGPLMKLDVASGESTVLGDAGETDRKRDPMWSPDGRQIAFTSDRDGPRALYVMDADPAAPGSGSHVTRVGGPQIACPPDANSAADYVLQDWRPDGKALAYVAQCHDYRMAKMISLDGVDLNPDAPRYRDVNTMRWSPDGKHIALGLEAPGGALSVAVANADGSDQKKVFDEGFWPRWSPGTGSQRIVFPAWDQNKLISLYVADADPAGSWTAVTQLTGKPGAKLCPR